MIRCREKDDDILAIFQIVEGHLTVKSSKPGGLNQKHFVSFFPPDTSDDSFSTCVSLKATFLPFLVTPTIQPLWVFTSVHSVVVNNVLKVLENDLAKVL